MKEKYTFYYKRLRRYQDSDENTEKEPSSKSKVKVGLLPLSPLRWGKTGNKNGQLVWRHCCAGGAHPPPPEMTCGFLI